MDQSDHQAGETPHPRPLRHSGAGPGRRSAGQSGALLTAEVRESLKHTVVGGQTLKESIMGVIIILLTPAHVIDPFSACKPPILMP